MSDEPIDPADWGSVVDIGDIRVSRGMTRRPETTCQHKTLIYTETGRRVWCPDCERSIDPFDAFMMLVNRHDDAAQSLKRRKELVEDAEAHTLRRRASKNIDKAWQSKNMVPMCPTCRAGLLPEDFANGGLSLISRELAEAARKRNR